jgi:hypothetical protein
VNDSARPKRRYRVFALFAAVVVTAATLSPSAYADDDQGPSIVVGGTVHPPTAIVVDPETPTAATGPIDPAQPIAVDPRVRPPVPQCCNYGYRYGPGGEREIPTAFFPSGLSVVQQRVEENRKTYLDNYGRYWLLGFEKPYKLEQVGGWPAPEPTNPSDQPRQTHPSSSIYLGVPRGLDEPIA